MSLNYLGIVSYGSYPTPTPSDSVRSRLAVSMGLLTFEFPSFIPSAGGIVAIVVGKIKGVFLSKNIYL